MAEVPKSGDYGGGYLKVQRHWRTAVMSTGFVVATIIVAPCVAQSQLTGYQYPAKHAWHTQPQDGWLYTAANPPVFDATVTVAPVEQSQLDGYKYPAKTVRHTQPQDGWLYTASLPFDSTVSVAPVEQSQIEGYRTPRRAIRQTDSPPVYDLLGTYSPALDNESSRPAKKLWRGHTEVQDGWLYTAATVDPTATVAAIGQSQLTGYRYPAHTVRQTDSQDGWFYETLPVVWDASKFQNNSGERTPAAPATRYRYDGYPATDWIYQNLPVGDVWDESKFQNISGEMTPTRPALKFRYPLASTGFSTDGSTPDVWDASKFQNIQADRMQDRRQRDPRYEYHKFPFGLVDARVVMPAIDQLANSERSNPKGPWPPFDQLAQGWIFTAVPPFDPQYLIQVSAPTRMADRERMDVRLQHFYNDMAWLRDVLALPDPSAGRIHRRTAKGWQRVWFG